MTQLPAAEAVLGQRADLAVAATVAGVTLPPTLVSTFEGDAVLPAAAADATAELTTVEAIPQAEHAQPANLSGTPGVLILVGLVGSDPASDASVATSAFTARD